MTETTLPMLAAVLLLAVLCLSRLPEQRARVKVKVKGTLSGKRSNA
jgi:hypothetical protein